MQQGRQEGSSEFPRTVSSFGERLIDPDIFFRNRRLRYVVVELKTTTSGPCNTGNVAFYVALVDNKLHIRSKHARLSVSPWSLGRTAPSFATP